MDKKQMLQDGYKKEIVYIVVSKDINGKEHFIVVDNLDTVKKYKNSSEKVCPVSLFYK